MSFMIYLLVNKFIGGIHFFISPERSFKYVGHGARQSSEHRTQRSSFEPATNLELYVICQLFKNILFRPRLRFI